VFVALRDANGNDAGLNPPTKMLARAGRNSHQRPTLVSIFAHVILISPLSFFFCLDSRFRIPVQLNNIVPNGMDDPLNHPKMVVVSTYLKLYFVLDIFDAFNHYKMRNRID
jgi:hypothetical protein